MELQQSSSSKAKHCVNVASCLTGSICIKVLAGSGRPPDVMPCFNANGLCKLTAVSTRAQATQIKQDNAPSVGFAIAGALRIANLQSPNIHTSG